jgi:hypothetical protein
MDKNRNKKPIFRKALYILENEQVYDKDMVDTKRLLSAVIQYIRRSKFEI